MTIWPRETASRSSGEIQRRTYRNAGRHLNNLDFYFYKASLLKPNNQAFNPPIQANLRVADWTIFYHTLNQCNYLGIKFGFTFTMENKQHTPEQITSGLLEQGKGIGASLEHFCQSPGTYCNLGDIINQATSHILWVLSQYHIYLQEPNAWLPSYANNIRIHRYLELRR